MQCHWSRRLVEVSAVDSTIPTYASSSARTTTPSPPPYLSANISAKPYKPTMIQRDDIDAELSFREKVFMRSFSEAFCIMPATCHTRERRHFSASLSLSCRRCYRRWFHRAIAALLMPVYDAAFSSRSVSTLISPVIFCYRLRH